MTKKTATEIQFEQKREERKQLMKNVARIINGAEEDITKARGKIRTLQNLFQTLPSPK